MLLIDGAKYAVWTPPTETEFERMVKEHAQDIFGEESIYLDMKHKLKSKSGIGSIPDGYVIVFGDSPHWHIVEVELSAHPLHEHIVSQVGKFINGIKNPSTQKEIANAIHDEITKDDFLGLRVKKAIGPAEIYKFLFDLVSKPPVLTIIIERNTPELEEAISALAHPEIKVVEFQTFIREGAGLGAHAHLFEPLHTVNLPPRPPSAQRVTVQHLLSAGLMSPGQKLFKVYKGKRYEAEITPGGQIRLLHDNSAHNSLSGAADHITSTSNDGWEWWHTLMNGQELPVDDLRKKMRSGD